MKLWRRRPLSVDLTKNNLTVNNEMPPSLVYISPGNHSVSKRCSLIGNEILSKPHYFSDITSFNSTDKCPLPSFKDCNNSTTVSFEDGTIRSTRLSNKSYLSPVSAEWLPVKDVMKIKRSASVPFHSPQSQPVNVSQPATTENTSVTVKSHVSLADKIRTLFRTRSTSRCSKAALITIKETKTNNKGKVCLRSSRTRTKEGDACKSMFESSSRVQDQIFSERLNHVLRDCATRPIDTSSDDNARKTHPQNMETFRKLEKKKEKPPKDSKKKPKDVQLRWDSQKLPSPKGFSESVVSHTASSAAKCKTSSPKSHNNAAPKTIISYRYNDTKPSIVKTNSCKYEFPLARELSQPIIAPNCDKKNRELNKSDSIKMITGKMDIGTLIHTRESLLSNNSIQPSGQYVGDLPNILDGKSSNERPEEDDYVTLAEVDLSLASSYSFMTQSIHDPIICQLAKSNHEYENIDLRNFQPSVMKPQPQTMFKYANNHKESHTTMGIGQQKQRPISCIAVVEANNRHHNNINNNTSYSSREPSRGINPKSPYLSQYTKLYSLKVTGGKIMYTHQLEPQDCEIMTRSQTSCPYKTPTSLGKETSGKRSIDSGLVDDLSMNFHTDSSVIQT